jgi:hypothetical protein
MKKLANGKKWYIHTIDDRTLRLLEVFQTGGQEEKPVNLACDDGVTRKLWPVTQDDFSQFDDLELVYETYCSNGLGSPVTLVARGVQG